MSECTAPGMPTCRSTLVVKSDKKKKTQQSCFIGSQAFGILLLPHQPGVPVYKNIQDDFMTIVM